MTVALVFLAPPTNAEDWCRPHHATGEDWCTIVFPLGRDAEAWNYYQSLRSLTDDERLTQFFITGLAQAATEECEAVRYEGIGAYPLAVDLIYTTHLSYMMMPDEFAEYQAGREAGHELFTDSGDPLTVCESFRIWGTTE